jgi:hypothetical protein
VILAALYLLAAERRTAAVPLRHTVASR